MADTPLSAFRKIQEEETEKARFSTTIDLNPQMGGTRLTLPDYAKPQPKKAKPPKPLTPLDVLGSTGAVAGRAMGALVDKPGDLGSAAFEGAKGLREALTPGGEVSTPSSEAERRTGEKLPRVGAFLMDAILDPGNLIAPEKMLGAGAVAGMAMGSLKKVDDVAKLGGKVVDDLGRVTDDAVELAPKLSENVPGLGKVQDAIVDGGIFPEPKVSQARPAATIAKLDADDEILHPFIERHTGLDDVAKKEVKDIFFAADNFWDHRRMGMTMEQANKLADDVNVKIDLPSGTALNQEQTLALRSKAMGLVNRAKEISDDLMNVEQMGGEALTALGQKYNTVGEASILQLKAIREEAWLQAKIGLQSLSGARSEAGKALNSYKELRRAREMGDNDFIVEALKRDALPEEAWAKLNQFGGDKVSQYKYLRSLTQPDAQQMWRWFYISNLLSGPLTQARNFIGNAVRVGAELAVTPVAAGISKVRGGEKVFLGESLAQFPGVWAGMKSGTAKASFMFKNGFSKDMAYEFVDTAPEAFKGAMLPNVVGRTLNATDEFFRTVGFEMSRYKLAYATAAKEGLKGEQLLSRAAELIDNSPVEMVKEAKKIGAEMVFRQPAGPGARAVMGLQKFGDSVGMKFGEGINKGVNTVGKAMTQSDVSAIRLVGKKLEDTTWVGDIAKMPLGTFLVPFISTPINIMRTGMQFTPVGLGKGLVQGGREGSQLAARGAMGTAMMYYAAQLAIEGKLTGSGPEDPAERDKFFAEGRMANAVKIGDNWVSYQAFAPIAMPLSMVANAVEAAKASPDSDHAGIASQVIMKTAKSVLQQSYLTGMMGLIEAINDGERKAEKFFGRLVTGFIPASGLARNVRSVTDNVLRDPEGIKENVMAALPGLSKQVPARLDYAGRSIRDERDAVSRSLNPVRINQDKPDATRQMLVDSDTYYTKPPQTLRGVEMTRQEGVEMGKVFGALMEQELSKLSKDPQFMALPLEDRRREIEGLKREISSQVREYFRAKHGGASER